MIQLSACELYIVVMFMEMEIDLITLLAQLYWLYQLSAWLTAVILQHILQT